VSRHARHALELAGGAFAIVVVMFAVAAWRLSQGPVPLDRLAPYLAASLSNRASGVTVEIAHAFLALGGGARIELEARDVRVRVGQGGARMVLPELRVDFSLGAALRGVIAPTRIVLERPVLRLARDTDGDFHLGIGASEAATSETGLRRVLTDLAAPPNSDAALGQLRELVVQQARFVFADAALGVVWRASPANLDLHRDAEGMRGTIALAVAHGGHVSRLAGEVDYGRATGALAARLAFGDLEPASWARAVPALAPLAALALPVSGTVRATLDPARLAIVAASCDVRFGAGTLRLAELPGGGAAVTDGTLAASYDPAAGRVSIAHAALTFAGPSLTASGTIDGVGRGLLTGAWPTTLAASLALEAHDVAVADLARLWPETLAPQARRWAVSHLRGGMVELATAQLGLAVDLGAPGTVAVRAFAGRMAYRGLALDYFGNLPPAHGIDGSATFDRATVTFTPTSAAVLGIHAGTATITLSQLGTDDSRIAIAATLAGPLADALAVLDSAPLGHAGTLGIAPRSVGGSVTARVNVAFPLAGGLAWRQVSVAADADLAGVAIPGAAFGKDLRDGKFHLRLDRASLRLDGTAALAGVAMTLAVERRFAAKAGPPMRISIKAALDGAARRALGLDVLGDAVAGTVGAAATYTAPASGPARAAVALDLGPSALDLAPLGWRKPAGTPAKAQFTLVLHGTRVAALENAAIDGGGLAAQLTAAFDAAGQLSRVAIPHLAVGATDAHATAERASDGTWHIAVAGPSFDASALADWLDRSRVGTSAAPPLVLDVRLGRLVLGPSRTARDVRANLVSDRRHWQAATITATEAGGAKLRLRYGTVADRLHFDLQADDFGGFVQLLGISDHVKGGKLHITGAPVDEGARRRLDLTVNGTDFRVVGAPLLARLLSLGSLSGIGALLHGEGIPFTRLQAGLVYGADRIVIDNFRADGGDIGITGSGTVEQAAGRLDLSGTLIPAYALNTVLGNIPVVGKFLLGGEGQGIFGANYRVAGPLADPQVSVNPLSALAPGFLRQFFPFTPPAPGAK
jgi:Protein of unknown function/AsmA-like C-terminal region